MRCEEQQEFGVSRLCAVPAEQSAQQGDGAEKRKSGASPNKLLRPQSAEQQGLASAESYRLLDLTVAQDRNAIDFLPRQRFL